MKKASANMWWIIIGAVIALVVLIVMLMIFTGKSSSLEDGILDCKGKGGSCEKTAEQCTGTVSRAFNCPGETNPDIVCCFESDDE